MFRSIVAEQHNPETVDWFYRNINSAYADQFGEFAPFISASEQEQIVEFGSLIEEVELEAVGASVVEASAVSLALGSASVLFPLAVAAGIGLAIYELWPHHAKQQQNQPAKQSLRTSAPSPDSAVAFVEPAWMLARPSQRRRRRSVR